MRASYLLEDRPGARFSCGEITRLMSEPCVAGLHNIKLLAFAWVRRFDTTTRERQEPPKLSCAE